ncbi:TIGR01459 family HAD-type hydrolase [Gluconacetobacter azotocaptans]|uniref:TIGR01459 family HAD-type hydrolase n=1 Tax=Gluconacetobacter azotocaptans TaxID=142834 RepID=A0A7W4JSF4_9PROT|nr:TIGR01459 family HAD-type hydrolase [Gluconacetobacter azotocaptans]MBB2190053.1 TIGR01459 family HAD-type hydrolase [Gluconacetobacter azotocaptans]GBQ37387.1 hydrolase IIA [Gluconacetobacter azotocaptans DSM 13594]
MQALDDFAPLAARYDGFIVDLWGVVHDGVAPYPGARDCLARLCGMGRRVVLLSNAPRRVDVVREGLRAMGVTDDLYDGIMTSGEYTRGLLRGRTDPWCAGLGRRMFHMGAPKDFNLFEGLDLEQVTDPASADFILNTGPDQDRGENDPAPYLPVLAACAAHGLKMICANPDMEVIRGGRRLICAGLLASLYEQKGGEVRWIGKPYPEVYQPVLDMLGLPRDRVLAVGDALATDMRGAQRVGVDGCWVLGGIHQEMIGDNADLARAEAKGAGLTPVATVPGFRWS